jgi:hypothetical protein
MNIKFIGALILILWCLPLYAAGKQIPVERGIVLDPQQTHLITIESRDDLKLRWRVVQEQKCAMNCIEVTDKSGGFEYKIATDLGAFLKFKPVHGLIKMELKNNAGHSITVDVFRLEE